MFDTILKIFLFLSPIIFLPLNGYTARFQFYQFGFFSGSINLLQLQFFQYGTIILFLTALFDKPKRLFQDRYFGLLFFLCIWSVFLHPKTIQNFHNLFLGFLLYYLVVVYAKNIKSVLKVIVIVSALNTIFAILQTFNTHLIYYPKPHEIIGLMSYKIQLGIYQALAVPICYAINPYLAIIPLIGLLLSKSLLAIVAMLVGMVYLLRKKISKIQFSFIYFMVFASLVIFYFIKLFNNMKERIILRLDVWFATLQMISKQIIYGYGVGTFKYVSDILKKEYTDPYSLYLETAHALGILGILALFLFLIDRFRGFKNNSSIAQGLFVSCLILVLCGLGYSFMDYPRFVGTVIILFGLLTIKKGEIDDAHKIFRGSE